MLGSKRLFWLPRDARGTSIDQRISLSASERIGTWPISVRRVATSVPVDRRRFDESQHRYENVTKCITIDGRLILLSLSLPSIRRFGAKHEKATP